MVKLKGDKEVGDKINKIILKSVRRGPIKGIIGLSPNLAMLHVHCALTYFISLFPINYCLGGARCLACSWIGLRRSAP